MDLLGQYDESSFTAPVPVYTKSSANNGPNKFGINFVAWTLVDTVNWRLFISESTNNRVVVYALNSDGTLVDHVPDNILGQSNYYSAVASTQQNTLSSPAGMAYDSANNRLFVSDSSHARIMVYDVASITDGENATNVLGQPNFIASVSGPTQNTMSSPEGLSYDSTNNRLFVATYGYSRVVLYDVTSITNGENATNVLGQTNYAASSSALTQKGMNTPHGVAYDAVNNRLFVSDSGNNRLLTFDISSVTDGQNAVNVLGAADFTTSNTVTQQNTMFFPVDLAYDSANNRLFVPQFNSTRIAVYDVASITNGENATNVLGQTVFNSSGGGTTQSTMSNPIGVSYDSVNQKLFYTDRSNYRLLVFDVNAITNGEAAVDLIGQYDESSYTAPVPVYTKSGSDNGPNRFGFSNARSVAVDTVNRRLFVTDQTNNRVLVYAMNSNGTFVDRVPDNILGRPNFYSLTASTQQNGMSTPTGLTYDSGNNRLFVAQSGNNRVTVYDVTAITDGENATNILGQPNFQASTAATQQNGMSSPLGLVYDSTNNRLFVAQSGNNRVTIYDIAAITNGENATNLLGQPNFQASTAATQQNGMNVPIGLAYDSANNQLFVAQSTANRVTVYDVSSIANGQNATNVLGQPNYTRATAASQQNGMNVPSDIAYDSTNNRLFVAQSTGNRVTIYDIAAITDGENATNVLGQPNYTASTAATQQNAMSTPVSVAYDTTNQKLFVGQSGANRVTVYDVAGLVSISGTVYSDQGTTTMASGRTVAVSINGAAAAGTATTAADGTYTISSLSVTAGDVLTLYLDGASERAVTVTVGSSANLTGINLYQNNLITRCDNSSCSLTNANLSTAATNADTDITAIYTVNSSVLNVKSGKALFIPASHSFTPGNNVNVGSGVTINGTLLPQSNTITLSGSWLKTGTFTASTSTVKFNGSGDETLNAGGTGAGSSFATLTVNKSAGTLSLLTNAVSGAAITIAGGTFSQGGLPIITAGLTVNGGTFSGGAGNLSVSGALTLSSGTLTAPTGTFAVTGYWTKTGGTFSGGTSTVTFRGGGTQNVRSGTGSFRNIVINKSGGRVQLTNTGADINGNLTITTGTLASSGQTIHLSGSWLNTGVFVAGTGSIVLDGGSQTLSGSTSFYSLTKIVASAQTLTFSAGSTFTVTGALILQGASSTLLSLRSSLTGLAWKINPIGSRTADYLDVKDSNNTNATAITCTIDTCTDSGNNTNWSFPITSISSSSSSTTTVTSVKNGGSHGGYVSIMAKKIIEASKNLFVRFTSQILGIIDTPVLAPTTPFVSQEERSLLRAAANIESHPTIVSLPRISAQRGLLLATVNEKQILFKDVPTAAWYAPYVSTLIEDGIAQGYKDSAGEPTGEFGVGNPVTYAEALKMALEVSGKKIEGGVPRNESAKNTWATAYVKTAENMHLSAYDPARDVSKSATRGAVVQTILEALGITIGKTPSTFGDVAKNNPYSSAIAAAAFFGLIQGDTAADGTPLNTFRPDAPINRAEVAKIIALAKALKP